MCINFFSGIIFSILMKGHDKQMRRSVCTIHNHLISLHVENNLFGSNMGIASMKRNFCHHNAWDQTFQMMFKFSFIMLQSVSCYLQIWSFTKSQNIKCLIICQEYQYKKKLIVNTQLQTVNVHKNADNYNGPMCGDLNK